MDGHIHTGIVPALYGALATLVIIHLMRVTAAAMADKAPRASRVLATFALVD